MRTVYHFPLCPFSRKVRVLLKEKGLSYELVKEQIWKERPEFLALNPVGEVPVLVEQEGDVLADAHAITEYLEECYGETPLLAGTLQERAEIRRIAGWFDGKFYREISGPILFEKIYRYLVGAGEPKSEVIRIAKKKIPFHIDYIAKLLRERKWLAGDRFSLADISAASQLSVIDYVGDVPWGQSEEVKDWYALIKSRPSFRPLLADRIPNFPPPADYANLDF